jgi:phage gpG-like protein
MIGLRVRTEFHAQKIKQKVAVATFRSLGHAGAAIRLTARRSIRRRKNPSLPGTPPSTQTGRLKRSIRYERFPDTVLIGPVNEIAGKLWNLHEFGGVRKRRRKLRRHKFRVGEYGPISAKTRGIKTTFLRIRLQTAAQANRATRLIEEENERRATQRARYPRRPFMGPALEINRPRLPRFWANSVK